MLNSLVMFKEQTPASFKDGANIYDVVFMDIKTEDQMVYNNSRMEKQSKYFR